MGTYRYLYFCLTYPNNPLYCKSFQARQNSECFAELTGNRNYQFSRKWLYEVLRHFITSQYPESGIIGKVISEKIDCECFHKMAAWCLNILQKEKLRLTKSIFFIIKQIFLIHFKILKNGHSFPPWLLLHYTELPLRELCWFYTSTMWHFQWIRAGQ